MKNLLYILLFIISACSPDNDLALLEAETSPMSPESLNLESEPHLNLDTGINMMVNSSTVNCSGEMEGTCLLVQEGDMIGTENWENFYYYDSIEGFNYEAGFVYGLIVKKTNVENPLAGGSSIKYELVKIVSTVPENATEISNVTELIAGLESDRNLYLKPGNYILPNTLVLNNLSNLKVTGANGAVITGNLITLIQFRGTTNSISFNNIVFNSTSTYNSSDGGAGIVYFDGSAEDILFENCEFTCPKVVSNGLKFVSENASRSKNITINKCNFHDIGRMGFETQNHMTDGLMRITDVTVSNCEFNRMGLQSPYGMAISLSGSGQNAMLNNNNIVDSRARGIENAGWSDITITNNTFSSPNTAYEPITCQSDITGGTQYIYNIVIEGNSGTVTGTGDHLIGLSNCDGAKFIDNNFSADALNLVSTINSEIYGNTHYSDGGIGLYIEQNSNNNSIHDNTFVTTADNATTVAIYPPSSGNVFQNNILRREGNGGGNYNDMDGGNLRQ